MFMEVNFFFQESFFSVIQAKVVQFFTYWNQNFFFGRIKIFFFQNFFFEPSCTRVHEDSKKKFEIFFNHFRANPRPLLSKNFWKEHLRCKKKVEKHPSIRNKRKMAFFDFQSPLSEPISSELALFRIGFWLSRPITKCFVWPRVFPRALLINQIFLWL